MVAAKLQITDGTAEEIADLISCLRDDDQLHGLVSVTRRPILQTDLGSVTDMLTVALGASGTGTALVTALKTWLTSRRSKLKITVRNGGQSVTVELETLGQVMPELKRILGSSNDET